jgi:hypothetical protein
VDKPLKKNKPKLLIDWASHKAAKYACENWHYSKSVPPSKTVKIGAWEDSQFIGVVIFSHGATPQIGSPYKLKQSEVCELTRIALSKHSVPVSRIMSIAIKFLKKHCPKTRLVVSYADLMQNHYGGIYQATNWTYVGRTKPDCFLKVKGKILHRKTVYDRYSNQGLEWLKLNIDRNAERIPDDGKHKYLMPLDIEMKEKISKLSKPYPKRASSKDNVAISDQEIEGGVSPTDALQS